MNTELLQIQDRQALATALLELHKRWAVTMQVSVWGRGKATRTDKNLCPDTGLVGKAKYHGDCDNCEFFMGARFESGRQYMWGDYAPACCALELGDKTNGPAKTA